jgi:uncharacterized protein DUF2877
MPLTIAGRYNRPVRLGAVTVIGRRAAELLRSGDEARVLAPLSASIYIVAAGEVLWLGGPGETRHCRAVLLSEPPPAASWAPGDRLRVPPCSLPPWDPEPAPSGVSAGMALRRAAAGLAAAAPSLGRPEGFGARLVGTPLAFPLADAAAPAAALAAACAADAPGDAAAAALTLLGLGPGLTPSGDDFVGGAFFARAVLSRAGACDRDGWGRAAETVRGAAASATHPISAALLGDLLDGEGWEPLHGLASALARDDGAAALEAARRLTRLGQSSGWDLLAGFVAGSTR